MSAPRHHDTPVAAELAPLGDDHVELVHGTCDGRIVWPPRGSGGHGYDPCFQPVGERWGNDQEVVQFLEGVQADLGHERDRFRAAEQEPARTAAGPARVGRASALDLCESSPRRR